MLDVTEQVARVIKQREKEIKGVLVSVPHTTAGVLLNECADPSVAEDILEHLEKWSRKAISTGTAKATATRTLNRL